MSTDAKDSAAKDATPSDAARAGRCFECGKAVDPLLAPAMGVVTGRVVPFCSLACHQQASRTGALAAPAPAPRPVLATPAPTTTSTTTPRAQQTALATRAAHPDEPRPPRHRWTAVRIRWAVGLGILLFAAVIALGHARGCLSASSAGRTGAPPTAGRSAAVPDRTHATHDAKRPRAARRPAPRRRNPAWSRQSGRPRNPARFRFAVMSDLHVSDVPTGLSLAVREGVVAVIELINPALVLVTGDLIDIPYGPMEKRKARIWAMWRRFDRNVTRRFRTAGIGLYPTPGNHDTNNAWSLYHLYWGKRPRRRFPVSGPAGLKSYYSFDVQHAHFVSLLAPGTRYLLDRPRQLAWLAADLKRAKARGQRLFFTFAHSPLFCPKLEFRCPKDMPWLNDPTLISLMRKYKVVHFGGHMHIYDDRVFQGVRTFTSGVLGKRPRHIVAQPKRQRRGFLVVDVLDQGIRVYRVTHPDLNTAHIPPSPADQAKQPPSPRRSR